MEISFSNYWTNSKEIDFDQKKLINLDILDK